MSATPDPHHVVIVGGGFGGLYAARALRRAPVRVTLVDRRNFHLFQPLLYQVATGGLSPADVTAPLRAVLKRQRNTRVLLDEVVDIDAPRRELVLSGERLAYDSLIVAVGAGHHYFGNDAWAEHAPGLKTIEDATAIRRRILEAFEAAERTRDAAERAALLTFVIVGAGPTGVELAGAIGELAKETLSGEFRSFDPAEARILLVEGTGRVLPGYPAGLSAAAARSLERLGVDVRTSSLVREIESRRVTLERDGSRDTLAAATVLWAAGVRATPLIRRLAEGTGAPTDAAGRLEVEPDCSVPGHPEVVVVGDACRLAGADGVPLPGIAPVAMQQGRYAARRIVERLANRTVPPFRYRNRGQLAVIGRAAAVADLGKMRFSGYVAWLLWLFIHIMYLVEFENRLLVFVQWAYSYFTRKRGARLITKQGAVD